MKIAKGTFTSTSAEEIISLKDLEGSAPVIDEDIFLMADFDIEVVGNDAAVTMTAIGPFSNSGEFSVTGGSFAISGGKVTMTQVAIGQLVFNRTGTTSYTINIIRRIQDV